MLFKHLYKKFESKNSKDYMFSVKNISKEINWSPYKVLAVFKRFRTEDIISVVQPRRVRYLWKTNFENKTKEDLENVVVQL